jgi:UPF0755 protein
MTKRTLFRFLILLIVALMVSFIYLYKLPHQKADFGDNPKFLFVKKGDSAQQIGTNLEQMGAISSKSKFVFFAKLLGKSQYLKVGRYEIQPRSSLSSIIGMIVRGESTPFDITIPEGFSMGQIANLLESTLDIDMNQFHETVTDRQILDSLGVPGDNLEGYLSPSTYNFYYQENPRKIISTMVTHFYESLPDSFNSKARNLGLTSNQAVTLASMIEREARLDSERPIIAAVYLNRLKKGMRLECDPTVIYALGGLGRPLLRDDLDFDSPYNTYRNYGLPPGPIANPGVKSLEAAVNPSSAGYLYFVANGDGGHIFSYTLDDHNNARIRVKRHNHR